MILDELACFKSDELATLKEFWKKYFGEFSTQNT
jgi:hypothetical protein